MAGRRQYEVAGLVTHDVAELAANFVFLSGHTMLLKLQISCRIHSSSSNLR